MVAFDAARDGDEGGELVCGFTDLRPDLTFRPNMNQQRYVEQKEAMAL